MASSPSDPADDTEHKRRIEWLDHVRRLHRNKRMIGFAGIVLGACMVMWWKMDAAAPEWALYAGSGILLLSWLLFIYVIVSRWRWVKSNPYQPIQR